jgi:hypothetical protein
MDSVYLLYAFLCGGSIYVAFLRMFGRRPSHGRAELVLGYLALAFAFLFLALGRAQAFGIVHGQLGHFTRLAFAVYGLSLVAIIGRYWVTAWQARRR